ncbi:MAG: 3-methyl-2-oxobutanoate hydroxymethyltransferase [Verrucomicrobiales bacterium]
MADSTLLPDPKKLDRFIQRKGNSPPISALTAYDYPVARLLDEAGIEIILVGDSLGMMVFGHEDTTQVTVEMMIHHTRACRKGVRSAALVADLPCHSYETPDSAVAVAELLTEAGADAVKLEGGIEVIPQVNAIIHSGITVIGHIGMLPQRVREEGGYKKKGKTSTCAQRLLTDAAELDAAGVKAIVLENIVAELAGRITTAVSIPTIGIAAGPGCDGQILVVHDLLGSYPWFCPGFVKPQANLASETSRAVKAFIENLTRI